MDFTEIKYREYVLSKCFDLNIDGIELIIYDILSARNSDEIDLEVDRINRKTGKKTIINYFLFMYYSF